MSFNIQINSTKWEKIYPATLEIPELSPPYPREKYEERLSGKSYLALSATIDNKIVGFKIGYPVSGDTFYSWVGGVHPNYRRMGIASALADQMEMIGKERGFRILQMKTRNRFKAMLVFALSRGFYLTEVEKKDTCLDYRIYLEKRLFDGD